MKQAINDKSLFHTLITAFGVCFIVNFIVYLPELAHMPLGDHDLGYLPNIAYTSGGGIGRWFLPFLYALRGFEFIPVFISILAFFSHISAGMAAVYLWYKDAKLLQYVVGGLMVSLIPFSTEHFFFHWQADTFGFAQLFIILAIILSSTQRRIYFLAGVFLTTVALATYQSSIQTAAVCWFGIILLRLFAWDGTWIQIKNIFYHVLPSALALALGAVLYYISIVICKTLGLIRSTAYQLESDNSGFLDNFIAMLEYAFMQLWYSQAYFSKGLKVALLVMVIVSCCVIVFRVFKEKNYRKISKALLIIFFILIFIILSKIQTLIVAFNPFAFRILATSLPYIYLFFLLILFFSLNKYIKYISYCFGIVFVLAFTVTTLKIQYSFIQQNRHDYAVINRIIFRIESLDNFDAQKEYTFVLLGVAPTFNSLSFDKNYEVPGSPVATNSISFSYPPTIVFQLLTPYIKIKSIVSHTYDSSPELVEALEKSVSRGQYPAKDSCFIYDDKIVVILDKQAVIEALERIQGN